MSPRPHFSTRNFILGKNEFISSHIHYKRILLTGQLCLLATFVCVTYLVIDIVSDMPTARVFLL